MNIFIVLSIFIFSYFIIIFTRTRFKSIIIFLLGILLFSLKPVSGLEVDNVSRVVSFETLGLLMGMMIIVELLKESGFFTFVTVEIIKLSKFKFWRVMTFLMILIALLSAFLDNLVTIMLTAPIIFLLADTMEIEATPLIILSIFIDNIGGMSTVIGSPLNIVLTSISKIKFNDFIIIMGPAAIIAFVSTMILFRLNFKGHDIKSYNEKLKKLVNMNPAKAIENKNEMIISVIVFLITLSGFILQGIINIELALIAMFGGIILMLLLKKNFEDMAHKIDWDTMFFYSGLFTIAYSMEGIGVTQVIGNIFIPLIKYPFLLSVIIIVLSVLLIPFLSAVPGTLLIAPVIKFLILKGAPHDLWFAYAIGANLGTNLTPIGAVQNIVGISLIKKNNNKDIHFGEFMKYSYKYVFYSTLLCITYFTVLFLLKIPL